MQKGNWTRGLSARSIIQEADAAILHNDFSLATSLIERAYRAYDEEELVRAHLIECQGHHLANCNSEHVRPTSLIAFVLTSE